MEKKPQAHRLILDVDTGLDDAIALFAAVLSPQVDLIGVPTVRGNHPVEVCTENTLRVLDALGAEIPVFQGMSRPLLHDFRREVSPTHGDYLDLPPARTSPQPTHAVDWLIQTLLNDDDRLTLVPVGPLTNIAAAIRKEPRILPKIQELVIMGGGHAVSNMTPSTEFNIWVDPHAAKIVLNCGRPIRLVTLDATDTALISRRETAWLQQTGHPAAVLAARLLDQYIDAYQRLEADKFPGCAPVHDALAVLAVLQPDIVTSHFVYVDVETRGELTTGRTVCDFDRCGQQAPNATVAMATDTARFVQLLCSILGGRLGLSVAPLPSG